MKKLISILLCLLFVLSFSACGNKTPSENSTEENTTGESTTEKRELPDIVKNSKVTKNGAVEIYNGVYIYDIKPYSGKFVEDGSDDELKDIMSVYLINTTDVSYQMLDFTLLLPQGKYSFSAKTVFANSSFVVLEKDRNFIPPKTDEFIVDVTDVVMFNEKPSVHLDKFEITYTDKIINVKNITGEDIENVYVYYKNVKDDIFFGGITYRVSVGKVPAGEIIQTVAERFAPDSMKIVFVTYA